MPDAPSPSDEFPQAEAPCTPPLDLPVEEKPCTPEPTIEDPNVATCAPLTINQTSWVSHKCFTAECPDGYTGEPVTRCADATSDISQLDADQKALAAAQAAAEADLNCQLVSLMEDEATLVLSLEGVYEFLPLFEAAELNLDLFGDYSDAPHEDAAELDLDIFGEYTPVPIEEPFSLTLSMSPLSEYRLETLFEFATVNLDLRGDYLQPVIFAPDVAESVPIALTLSGVYLENIHSLVAPTDSHTLDFAFSGAYALVVITTPDESDAASLALSFSGEYILRTINLPERQFNTTLGLTLSGVYA